MTVAKLQPKLPQLLLNNKPKITSKPNAQLTNIHNQKRAETNKKTERGLTTVKPKKTHNSQPRSFYRNLLHRQRSKPASGNVSHHRVSQP